MPDHRSASFEPKHVGTGRTLMLDISLTIMIVVTAALILFGASWHDDD
jgi:dolichyl-phosphate-mannose--protein O-mannosyl transferase